MVNLNSMSHKTQEDSTEIAARSRKPALSNSVVKPCCRSKTHFSEMDDSDTDQIEKLLEGEEEHSGDPHKEVIDLSDSQLNPQNIKAILTLLKQLQNTENKNEAVQIDTIGDTPPTQQLPSDIEDTSCDPLLSDLTQEFDSNDVAGPAINTQLANIFQNLIEGKHKSDKLDTLLKETLIPSNLQGLNVVKVNPELWRRISHQKKSGDLKLQNLQKLTLTTTNMLAKVANNLLSNKNSDHKTMSEVLKSTIRECTNMVLLLGKLNTDLLVSRRELIATELNFNFKGIAYEKTQNSKYLFGDDFSKTIKEITETNKVSQLVLKKTSSPQNSFLFKSRGHHYQNSRGRSRQNQYHHHPYQHPRSKGQKYNQNQHQKTYSSSTVTSNNQNQ